MEYIEFLNKIDNNYIMAAKIINETKYVCLHYDNKLKSESFENKLYHLMMFLCWLVSI
jgi:hypothetical protein